MSAVAPSAPTISPAQVLARARAAWPAAVDAGFVVVLTGLGLVGFQSVYGGRAYLVTGLAGVILGIGVTELAGRLRQPVLAEAVAAVLAFLLLGGATTTVKDVVPSAGTITALGHVGIYGWKQLLTTAPPVGSSSDLLALPYIVGLVSGVAGQSVARRTRAVALPLLGPALALALGILFGARHPQSLALQGSVFGLLALGWTTVRFQRNRRAVAPNRANRNRAVFSVGILAAVGLLAGIVGPNLPGANSHARLVLSKYVSPPFEANQEPSPLAGFRQYVKQGPLHDKTLFTVAGLAPGTEVRIATMDTYDGVAWGFGAATASAGAVGDVYRRYGSVIQTAAAGQLVTAEVTVGQIGGPWLPEVGEMSRISFRGPGSGALTASFRYDTDTETAAAPIGLQPGEGYTFTAAVTPPVTSQAVLNGAVAGDVAVATAGVPSVLQADAASWSAGATAAYARVMAIAGNLRTTGYFSDGLENPTLSVAGHSTGRLTRFLEGGGLVGTEIVGDGEQYAATLALMADSIGVPARVVLGARVGPGGVVTGADVQPWVEVDLAGLGWQPIYASSFMDPNRIAHQTPPAPAPNQPNAAPVQPPVVSAQHSPLDGGLPGAQGSSTSHFAQPVHHKFHLPGWVLAVAVPVLGVAAAVAAFAGVVAGLKRRRRSRRRHAPSPAGQVAGAWRELIDYCRDLKLPLPAGGTRKEQAAVLSAAVAAAAEDLAPLAVRGDASVFGPDEPSPTDVDEYWAAVEATAAQMRSGLSRGARLRLRFSLRSLLPEATTA